MLGYLFPLTVRNPVQNNWTLNWTHGARCNARTPRYEVPSTNRAEANPVETLVIEPCSKPLPSLAHSPSSWGMSPQLSSQTELGCPVYVPLASR